MTTSSEKDVLIQVKLMAFVDELISKTKDGGLPWIMAGPNVITVTICEPSRCQFPANPTSGWTYILTKNNSTDGSYRYYLEVLIDGLPYLSVSSFEIDQVETLFSQAQIFIATRGNFGNRKVRRAIKFVSNLSTSPTSAISNFVMCGGVAIDGAALNTVAFTQALVASGAKANGSAIQIVVNQPVAGTDGMLAGGSAIVS